MFVLTRKAFFDWLNWHGENKYDLNGRAKMRAIIALIKALEAEIKRLRNNKESNGN